MLPHFVGGKAENRRDPAYESFADPVHRALRATTAARIFAHRVQAIFGHVEIQRAQIDAAEIDQCLHDFSEVVAGVRIRNLVLQRIGTMHDPAVERQHVLVREQVYGRVEAVQVAEQEARGVAQATIGVGVALEDFLRQRHFVGVIGGRDPQAQDVGAQRLHDVLRLDAVAERLRHFLAVFVDRESVGQTLPIRGGLVDRDPREQCALEPAAVLVGAFKIQVGGLAQTVLRPLCEHALVGDAGVEPHVENIGDFVVISGLFAQQIGSVQRIPRVHTGLLDALGDLTHQRG